MERFVFVTAITVAIIFGVVAVFGGPHFHFGIDGRADPVMAVRAGQMPAQTIQGSELRFRHIAAHITITPEDRQDFSIEITNPGHVPMPTVNVDGTDIVVDGRIGGRIHDCKADSVDVRGYSTLTTDQMPQIVVHAPRALHIDNSGAGLTEIGPTESLDLGLVSCGTVTAGDTAGVLKVEVAGSGHVHAGTAHSLNVDIAGSGRVETGAIAGGADVDIGGSGDVIVASVNGPLSASGAGSGSVTVNGGAVTTADLSLAGSGDVTIAAPVEMLKASIVGSGGVTVNGVVHDVDADIMGSGSVHATSVTGTIHKSTLGSGDVHIGG